MISRRIFLKNGGLALVSLGFAPAFLARTAAAADTPRRKVLVTIFQRGAVDGLNMIVPFGERDYYASRPSIAIARPGASRRRRDRSRRLLRPASAAGAAQAALRRAAAGDRPRLRLARRHALALRRAGLHGDGDAGREEHAGRLAEPLPARARARGGDAVPRRRARAAAAALAAGHSRRRWRSARSAQFGIRAGQATDMVQASFEAEYAAAAQQRAAPTGREAFDAVKMLKTANPAQLRARERRRVSAVAVRRGAQADRAARSRRTSASRSRSPNPATGITTRNEGAADGQLANRLDDFARGIAALVRDLGDRMQRRRDPDDVGVRPRGGGERQPRHRPRPRQRDDGDRRRRARRQGLRQVARPRAEQRYEGRDLAVTTDFRSVFAEVVGGHLGLDRHHARVSRASTGRSAGRARRSARP